MIAYESTRGAAPELGFAEVLLGGLAVDGGLYVPTVWPALPTDRIDLAYPDFAVEVMWPFVEGAIERGDFATLVADAYSTFDPPDVLPVVELEENHWLLQLFGGPTLAFKDVALQVVGRLFDHELARRGERMTIVGATSGDTGSAAIEACRDREAIDIFILHPAGRVSDVQRRQMTTVEARNVHNVAIEGSFDDCQDLVKAMFNDEPFRRDQRLGAVNSINWARVMAQSVYYVWAADRVKGTPGPVSFCVPTGNFGNIFAGYGAQKMGLDVGQWIVASNRNDILTRFLETGRLETRTVEPSLSPSMDIQVSSNFERLLFELYDRDGETIADLMARFRSDGSVAIDPDHHARLTETWSGTRLDDDQTLEVIADVHRRHGIVLDPHTAVGVGAARALARDDVPVVTLATAHPAKFPDAVEQATGHRPELPERLADLFDRPERCTTLPNDLAAVQGHIADLAG